MMYMFSCTNVTQISQREIWRLFNSFDTILTGCEGVLWSANQEIPNSAATLNRLREIGKQIFFLSNTSVRTRDELVQHAQKLGFIIYQNEIISSALLTAYYLKNNVPHGLAYVVGSRGLTEELKQSRVEYIGDGPDRVIEGLSDYQTVTNAYIDSNVTSVVVGLDEHFSYIKLIKAATYLKDPECEFLATTCEGSRSGFKPKVVPAAGAILKAIETCSGRKAKILGKPSFYVGEYLLRNHLVNAERALLIGDGFKIDTDFAHKCGFQSFIVLSGRTQKEELSAKIKFRDIDPMLPDLYGKSLGDLLPYLTLRN